MDESGLGKRPFVAIYMRTSYNSRWTDLQGDDLQRWTELKNWAASAELEVRWFKDHWTGSDSNRPDWKRLRAEIEADQVHTLTCWRLDRLGMTCSELVAFFDFLTSHGVNLISLKDDFDLSTPIGRRMAGVLASVAILETEIKGQRILAGQEAARARGSRWGGSTKGRRLKVSLELEAEVLKLHQSGTPIAQIARQTKLSRPTIYRVLAPDPPAYSNAMEANPF